MDIQNPWPVPREKKIASYTGYNAQLPIKVYFRKRPVNARPCWWTNHTKEAFFVISASSVNAPITALSVNSLTNKADITHWRIGRQGRDDGWSFLRMIRPSAWPRPYLFVIAMFFSGGTCLTFEVLTHWRRERFDRKTQTTISFQFSLMKCVTLDNYFT